MTDTKSPNIQEHLLVHFFRPSRRTPWWMRLGWWPTYSHVCVEWRTLIHDLPYGGARRRWFHLFQPAGTPKWYSRRLFLADKPVDATVSIPYTMPVRQQADTMIWIDNCYDEHPVERWRCVLWRFGNRSRRPRSCGTLASMWIKMIAGREVDAVTPDELYEQLKDIAVKEYADAE